MIQSFSEFYFDKIHSKLKILEDERKKGVRLFYLLTVVGFIVASRFFWKLLSQENIGAQLVMVATVFYLVAIYHFSFFTYKKKYKERILKIVFDAYLENGFFNPKMFIREEDYLGSFLYQGTYNKYSGEDYAEGDFLGHKIKLSELRVTYEKHTSKRKDIKVIFDGLLILCELKHPFVSTTVVEHDSSKRVFGTWLGGFFKKLTHSNSFDPIRLESSEFEKKFHVTAEDQVEARRVLTPFMQEHLLKMAKKSEYPLGISITPNQLGIALFTHKDFFEPPTFKTCVEAKSLRDIDLIFRLIRDIKNEIEKL